MNADAQRTADPVGSTTEAPSSVDDPRVSAALDEYLAELQGGRRPPRREFLGRFPEIAEALERGLDVLEFLNSAAGLAAPKPQGPAGDDVLPPETILGDYRLVREVGRGGMGVVYEARQISLGRRVAVKVLSGAGVPDPRRLERFRIEAQAVALLQHPHIVPIFAVGSDRGIHYYAMQYIEGRTLADVLEIQSGRRRRDSETPAIGPIDPVPDPPAERAESAPVAGRETARAVAELGIQAAEALDHAHAMGVLHRDIKPSNLLIDSRGGLWIADFGLARFRDDSGLTITGDLVGTLRYMAPEMATGRRLSFDPRSDIYALGATLYELLTLRPVFDGHDRRELLRQITQDEPVAPRRIDPSIPRDLETIVMRAMAKEPDRRYATASELADDLRRFLGDQPIRARPPSPWEHATKWARRHRTALMTAAGVGLVALGIGSALVWQEQRRTASVEEAKQRVLGALGLGAGLVEISDILTMKGMERFARTMSPAGQDAATRQFYQVAIDFYERLTRDPAVDDPTRALAFRRLGFTRMVSAQDPRAEGDLRRSIEIYEALLAAEPRADGLREGLADACYNLGLFQFYGGGGMARAEPNFRKAIAIARERAGEEPANAELLELLASYRVNVSNWMAQARMPDRAAEMRRELLDDFDRLTKAAAPIGPGPDRARASADSYRSLAQIMPPGQEWAREREAALRRGLAIEPDHPDLRIDLANVLLARCGDADHNLLREAVELARGAAEARPDRSETWRLLALAYLHAHDLPSATRAVDQSLKLRPAGAQASDRFLMAMIRWQEGRQREARDWYLRGLLAMARSPSDDPEAPRFLSEAQVALKPMLEAEKLCTDPDR